MERTNVSIIIPVFNVRAKLLKRCLTSILLQDVRRIQIIVIFDGLKEKALINEESVSLPSNDCISYVCVNHGGVSRARNEGIRLADGRWICFVDADDEVPQGSIKQLIMRGEQDDADIVMGSHIASFGRHREVRGLDKKLFDNNSMIGGDEFCRLVLNVREGAGVVWGKIIRASIIKNNNIAFNSKIAIGEDADFIFRVAMRAHSILVIPDVVYFYNRHKSSTVRSFKEDYVESVIASIDAMKRTISVANFNLKDSKDFSNYVAFYILLILVNYIFNPIAPWGDGKRKEIYKSVLSVPIFHDSLISCDYSSFSLPYALTLFTLRHRLYWFSSVIAKIRQWQFK